MALPPYASGIKSLIVDAVTAETEGALTDLKDEAVADAAAQVALAAGYAGDAADSADAVKSARDMDTPNILSYEERVFDDLTRFTVQPSFSITVTPVVRRGRRMLQLERAGTTASYMQWTIPVEEFRSSGLASCGLTIDEMTARTSGTGVSQLTINFRNSSGTDLSGGASTTIGNGASSTPTAVKVENLTIPATTAGVQVRIQLAARTLYIVDPVINGGNSGIFAASKPLEENLFPDPLWIGSGAIRGGYGSSIIASGERNLEIAGSGTLVQEYLLRATGAFAPGAFLTFLVDAYSVEAGALTASTDIRCLDASGASIGTPASADTSLTTAGVWETRRHKMLVPATTTHISLRVYKGSGASLARFRNGRLFSTISKAVQNPMAIIPSFRTFYVSPTGGAGDPGSYRSPVTLTRIPEILASNPGAQILCFGGDYEQSTNLVLSDITRHLLGPIKIGAVGGERPRFLSAPAFTSFTAVSGKVYKATGLTFQPAKYIWVHDVPDPTTLIPLAQRHSLQRGETYRLPSTKIKPVTAADATAAIAAIQAESGPTWWRDSGTNELYFSVTSGANPAGLTIRVPRGGSGSNLWVSSNRNAELILRGIDLWYGAQNLALVNGGQAELWDIFGFGAGTNGLTLDETARVQAEMIRAAGSGNDGFNTHYAAYDPGRQQALVSVSNAWFHDCWDDGESEHEFVRGRFSDCLSEYNGDRGYVPAMGAHVTYHDCLARYNGQEDSTGGEGFGIVNATAAIDPGVGTQADLYNCTSIGNIVNFGCGPRSSGGGTTSSSHVMNLWGQTTSRDASLYALAARVGAINVYGSLTDSGSAAPTWTADGGAINDLRGTSMTI